MIPKYKREMIGKLSKECGISYLSTKTSVIPTIEDMEKWLRKKRYDCFQWYPRNGHLELASTYDDDDMAFSVEAKTHWEAMAKACLEVAKGEK